MALATLLHIYRGPYIYIVFITEILSDQVRDNPMSEKFTVIDIVFGKLGNNKISIFRFNRNKSTLTVHFYLSTTPSEKIGILP